MSSKEVKAIANRKREVINLSENTNKDKRYIKVGYFSMGLSTILAGVLVVLAQLDIFLIEGVYILWPTMMILLGLETIITKMVVSLGNNKPQLKPAWGILVICTFLVACSQIWILIMDSVNYFW